METFDRKFTTSREDVYSALDSERAYQDSRWNSSTTTSEGKHTFEEWIVYMEDYLAEAKHILSREATQTAYAKTAHIMRKVTAMGVACMEQRGAPEREGFEKCDRCGERPCDCASLEPRDTTARFGAGS